ncbi:MAG: lipid A biosynthesis acyltransferase [Burkholderiales bacterium]
MSALLLKLLGLGRFLPVPLLRLAGAALGSLFYLTARERRAVAHANLAACFPALSDARRSALVRAVFRAFARSVLDRAVLWHGSADRVRRFVQIDGREHLDALTGRPVILLAPHFAGLDAGGIRITADWRIVSIYSRQKDAAFDAALLAGRSRFNAPMLLTRQAGVRSALRGLSMGLPFYYLPDMDFGARDAVFVPFFGVPAATVTALSRLARLSGASVLPCVTRMTADGYRTTIQPAWRDFPGPSLEEDARRINAFIEAEVREMPEQYHWLHKRFKTRPPGAPPFYKPSA